MCFQSTITLPTQKKRLWPWVGELWIFILLFFFFGGGGVRPSNFNGNTVIFNRWWEERGPLAFTPWKWEEERWPLAKLAAVHFSRTASAPSPDSKHWPRIKITLYLQKDKAKCIRSSWTDVYSPLVVYSINRALNWSSKSIIKASPCRLFLR